jgi:hypothetical protein
VHSATLNTTRRGELYMILQSLFVLGTGWGRIIEILDRLLSSFRELVLSCLLSETQYISLETDNFDACSTYEPTKCTKYSSVKHKI